MIQVVCKYVKLSDIPNLYSRECYEEAVKPLDYDFYLEKGAIYEVLGIITISGIPWLYIFRKAEYPQIGIFPAILFDYGWNKVPSEWYMRINGPHREDIEILPEKLASIEHWYERYIDEDSEVLRLVSSIVDNNR